MGLSLNLDTMVFHCRFSINAHSGKGAIVYLFLDASHVQSLEICGIDEAIPPSIMNVFGKRASDVPSNAVMGLRFGLQSHATLIAPDSTFQKRPATCEDLEALLRLEVSALREQVQQPQRAPGVDVETQSDPLEYEAVIAAEADLPDEAHTPASTVEDPTHDQFMMFGETFDERFAENFEELFVQKFEEVFEENFDEILDRKFEGRLYRVEMEMLDQGPFRWKLEERVGRKIENVRVDLEKKLEDSNKQLTQLKESLDHESNGLQHNIDTLAARVTDLEEGLADDLRKEFNEAIGSQKLDLQVKIEDAVEQRLADVEEIVKQDVRNALENGKTTFNFD
ncbi:hypothetical protein M436DRAFT_80511 [Aureobasidium namibiae CBS 147.97]|uniref:Uncharacterized protein n=1 Tax=Aureobasidium namibiae CBS 147.97 TaxID=1043004 RepID=A0A074WU33_9PEZI|nr:uncharacterized protein M436DRAFT_80511 [Aureobasidium namibiae CBS 147.97]KEQ75069.1 hypothetical protein M436DRAFT_80511 [Aureobasidium namibiae CBS 147.97]